MIKLFYFSVFLFLFTQFSVAQDIYEFVNNGDAVRLKEVLSGSPDLVNQKDSLARTPLHYAARSGNPEIVSILLDYNADVNAADSRGVTALHSASARGFVEIVKTLISNGADLEARFANGDTPLQATVTQRQAPVAVLLIEHGADINTVNNLQRTPLMAASALGMSDMVKILISSGADVNAKDSDGNEPLTYACGGGFAEIVEIILKRGGDAKLKDYMHDTPLHAASFSGSAIVGRLLLAHGIDPDVENKRNKRPIHNASEQGNIEFVHMLIKAGAELNPRDSLGMTPLHLAAANEHLGICKMLIENGADAGVKNNDDLPAQYPASANGYAEFTELINTGRITPKGNRPDYHLIEIASTRGQWTGVAISKNNRLFVNYPRWMPNLSFSVAEVLSSGEIRPFPDEQINQWGQGISAEDHFVCVQSVYCDEKDNLWILDTGNPLGMGVIDNGAKLVKVNLETDRIDRIYRFDPGVANKGSYLNDVRIDYKNNYAYMTDSDQGGIIVLNLATGENYRCLDNHHSTKAEDVKVIIGGRELTGYDGSPFIVHSDGIALNKDDSCLYYQALTGHTIYRIPTKYLVDKTLDSATLGQHVEVFATGGLCDGMIFDRNGNLYLSSIGENAVRMVRPDGKIDLVAKDYRIAWPDSFTVGADGSIYFTTSRIHEGGIFKEECKVYKLAGLK